MHRSGTSCLAGTLEQAGVCLGKVSDYNEYNKKGNKENNRTMELNQKILEYNHASWDQIPKTMTWNQALEAEGLALIKNYEGNCDAQYWGFKDPRVLLTLPFWNKLLPNAKFIGTFRNPLSVAESLSKRINTNIDLNSGLLLWSAYNRQLIKFHKIAPFPLISFDLPAEEYQKKLREICTYLKLNNTNEIDFFDKTLRNQEHGNKQLENHQDIIEMYNILQNL